MAEYLARIVDYELDELLSGLPAVAIEGPKAVGKTVTAIRRAATTICLDEPDARELLAADPARLDSSPTPILLDEWQRYPRSWDLVRRSVDSDFSPGRFILTGSAGPAAPPTHSGAGRISRIRMRPLSLAERGLADVSAASLAVMLDGSFDAEISGHSAVGLSGYVDEILASGFPAIRSVASEKLRVSLLDGYLQRIVDTDLPDAGQPIRRPATLRAWMAAYAAATSTVASYDTILRAATPGEDVQPAKTTTIAWREALTRIWMLDPVLAWYSPSNNQFKRLGTVPKHQLADPALAARLLGATKATLLSDGACGPTIPRDGTLLGALFESLIALSLRTYAQAADAHVYHLRTRDGAREIDFIVDGGRGRVVALEVKLSPEVADHDVRHLRWLRFLLGDQLADAAVITTGSDAYRRSDGIAVIPASLLGP